MKILNFNINKASFLLLIGFFLIEIYKPTQVFAQGSSEIKLENYINKIPDDNFYILGPGDVLKLNVSDQTDLLDSIFVIDGEGTANLKRLKRVYVQGLTIDELTEQLNEQYSKYLFKPNVQLTIVKYRPVKIYIGGQVENPGHYVLKGDFLNSMDDNKELSRDLSQKIQLNNAILKTKSSDDNLLNLIKDNSFPSLYYAIRKSGGLAVDADLKNILVTRNNSISRGSGKIKTTLNLLEIINLNDLSQNIRILDGDSIFVPRSQNPVLSDIAKATMSNINPKFLDIFISGRVNKPGKISVNKGSVLTEALEIGGGTKVIKGKLIFIRYNPDGTIERRKFALNRRAKRGSYNNPYLKNGDIIFAEKGFLKSTSEVVADVTSPLESLFSTYGFYKLVTGG